MDLARIKIEVDTREVKAANDDLADLAKKGKKAAEDGLDPIGKSASNAAGKVKLLVGGVIALASGTVLKAAVTSAKEFSTAISNLSAITGATGDDLEYLKQQALDIGTTTTLSASQAATAFKLIASAKPDLLESTEALNSVTRSAVTLAEAASIDLPTAAEALGKSLNQFGAGAEEANRFINVLAAGSKFGAAGISEVSESLKNVGAVASGVGLSIEETTTAIELLAAGGLSGAEAGTALRGVLLKLEKEGNANFQPAIVGLGTALENLRDAGMSSTEMLDLFGMEGINAANILVANAGAADELQAALTGTNTAIEQAVTNTDNLEGKQLALNSAMEGAAIAFGSRLEPALASLTVLATEAFGFLAENMDATMQILQAVGIAFGVYFGAQAAIVLVGSFGKIRMAIMAMNAAMIANPIGAVVTAVAIGAGLIITYWDDITKFAQRAAILIQIGWEKLKIFYQQVFGPVLEKIQDKFYDLKTEALSTLAGITAAAKNPLSPIESFNKAMETTRTRLDALKTPNDNWKKSVDESKTSIGNLETALADTYTVMDTATDVAIPEQITALGNLATENETVATAVIATTAEIDNSAQALKDKTISDAAELEEQKKKYEAWHTSISGFFSDLFTNGKSAFDNLAKGFKDMLVKMVADFLASKIMGYLGKLVSGFGSVGASIGSMLTSGAASAAGGSILGSAAGGSVAGVVGGAGTGIAGAEAAVAAQGAGGGGFLATAGGAIKGGLATVGKGIAAGGKAVAGFAKAALTNPVTAVIGAVLLAGALMAKKSTPSFNAGIITDLNVPLGKSGQNLGTETFASGLEVMKFGRRSDAGEVEANVDVFRTTDAALTGLVTQAGLKVDLDQSDFKGLDERGFANVTGRNFFFGSAGEEGKPGMAIERQVDSYTKDYFTGLWKDNPDLPRDKLNELLSLGSSEKMIERAALAVERFKAQQPDGSHANGLNRVPFDGYVAELHAGERVLTKSQTNSQDSMSADISALKGDIAEIMIAVARNTAKSFRIYDRWDKNGLPPTRAT